MIGTPQKETRNISEPLRTQEGLRTSEIRYRRLFEAARDGILILNAATLKITDVNPFMTELLGYSRDEFLGKELWEIGLFNDKEASQKAFRELQAKGYLRYENLPLQTKEGKRREVEFVSNVYEEDTHQVIQCNIRDITERKRAEEERTLLLARAEAARAEADTANGIKDEFLATVSHELRTPLTSILGWSQLLINGDLDEQGFKCAIETIGRNARLQRRLIDDLLDISRIITGKLRLDVRPVELAPMIEAVVKGVRPAADARKIQLQTALDPAVSPISGDADRLQQVIWNLVSNAIKFTPEGGRVHVRLEPIDSAGSPVRGPLSDRAESPPEERSPLAGNPRGVQDLGWGARRAGVKGGQAAGSAESHVQITISDTGQGVAPELLLHIFDRFRQSDSSNTRSHGGLGLGLSIVRQLVELHGGTVEAESAGEGEGTTFKVILPVWSVHHEPSDVEKTRPIMPATTLTSRPPSLNGLRVLIVDDEPDSREPAATRC